MIFNFPYEELGFSEEEWELIPRTDKVIIRDYELHGRDVMQTTLFNYYQTDKKIKNAVRKYDLRLRPHLEISLAQFHFPIHR